MIDISEYDPHTPKRVEDIVGNTDVWTDIANQIRTNTAPHIILCGPAGCGKSLFLHIVLEIESRHPILRIDCTANSGLRDLRDNVRGFARGSKTNEGNFRWIILERADALTADTQAFLRRMMETTSNSTRIVFECRDGGAISEPILSRSSLYTVGTPDPTEVRYELMRRTDFKVPVEYIESIVSQCQGNMRSSLLHVLALRWNGDVYTPEINQYNAILAKRPTSVSTKDPSWVEWAVEAEQMCRNEGYDLRDLLHRGWPTNKHVSYMCSQWSRLGGISPRALFFSCIYRILSESA